MASISKPISLRFAAALLILMAACLGAPAAWGEVRVEAMTGTLHATASSACPAEQGLVREDLLTEDLVDYQALAQADTASSCGAATGLSTLTASITAEAISVTMTAATDLDSLRSSSGSSYFLIEFQVTTPASYTLAVVGNHAIDLEPGVMGLGISIPGVYQVQEPWPDFSEDQSGTLAPGTYFFEGSCIVSRAAVDIGGGDWVLESGESEVLGSVVLTFTDTEVVAAERSSFGTLKARYR